MGDVLLYGIQHARTAPGQLVPEQLLDLQSRETFAEHILGRITNGTIVIPEGYAGTFRPGHPLYQEHLRHIAPDLAQSGVRPTLIGADSRYVSPRKDRSIGKHAQTLQAFIGRATSTRWPQTKEQLMAILQREEDILTLPETPSLEVRNALRAYQRTHGAFDAAATRTIKNNTKNNCVFIAGLTHCIRLHFKCGWELETFNHDRPWSSKEISSTYCGYYLSYLCPLKFD